MSRFGIRKKLRGVLGGRKKEIIKHEVTFVLPDGTEKTLAAEEGYTIAMATQFLPSPMETGCPDGFCGQCTVELLIDEGVNPPSAGEQKVLHEHHPNAADNLRLGCHAKIVGPGAKIKIFRLFDFETMVGD